MKNIVKLFSSCLLIVSQTFGSDWILDCKVSSDTHSENFQVFSERCSGSTFLQCLLTTNLKTNQKPLLQTNHFGHKHFPRWFEIPQSELSGAPHKLTFEGNKQTLFIILFRDPYDWIRSMNRHPHHAKSHLYKLPFSQFIRTQWEDDPKETWIHDLRKEDPFVDLDPFTRKPFKNIMQLRSAKIRTMLEIYNRVENACILNYETLRNHPEEVLEELATLYNLEKAEIYSPVLYYKGEPQEGYYKPKSYCCGISQNDLDFINSELDEELESLIGYTLTNNPKNLVFRKQK